MKVFLAGATGAIGRRLVPLLAGGGHEVVAMTRSREKAETLRALGAEPAVADGLDKAAVMAAVLAADPEVVVHAMTALADFANVKRWDDEFALTNRLRTEGLDILLEAARTAGARRFVAQSFGNWNYERAGGRVKSEDDPLDPRPAAAMAHSMEAIEHLEREVLGNDDIEGVALRYANLYGPGAMIGEGGSMLAQVRARKLPIIGDGGGVWSFVHLDDAAAATAAAVERGAPGIYNVADDEPATVAVWLPELARIAGAKPPRHVPAWLGRLASGEVGIALFTQIRGASNAKARRELRWEPRFASWREGFRAGLAASGGAVAGGGEAAAPDHVSPT